MAIGLIMHLLCSPICNQNFQKKAIQNIMTEQMPQREHKFCGQRGGGSKKKH